MTAIDLLQRRSHKAPHILLQLSQRLVLYVHHVSCAVVAERDSFVLVRVEAHVIERVLCAEVWRGEIKVACQQTCPANAIVFGNRNDPDSEVSKALKSERTYYVLEELNVQPGIGYQVKVRNTNTELEA